MSKKNKRYSELKVKKRDTVKYPALVKNLNLKSRQDEIEVDYINKLSIEEKEWLNKFNEEYVNASLDRENFKNNIHNTLELKQSCDKRNNDRKECVYTKAKAKDNLKYISDDKSKNMVIDDYENRLIQEIEDRDEDKEE